MTLLEVIERLAPEIENNPHVHAMWLEGSYATGKYTDKSDIDVWLDVDDGTFDDCIADFQAKLSAIGEIDYENRKGLYSNNPKLAKYIFHLKGMPKTQTIELDMQEHSRQFKFSRHHHVIKVFFDKDDTILWE